MPKKVYRKWNFNYTLHKAKNKRGEEKYLSNFIIIISKTLEKLTLVTLVTNYHRWLFLPFVVRLSNPDVDLKNKSV